MDKSQTISVIGHAVVLTWIVLGDLLFAPREVPPPTAVQVSMVSQSDLQAMMDAAPKTDKPPAEKPAVKPAAKPPEPAKSAAKPAPPKPALPKPAPPPPEPAPEVPVDANPQPLEAPPVVAPIAVDEQPVPVPLTDKAAKPKPIDRVAKVPVESPIKTPEVADKVVQETRDQPQPDQPVVEEKKPAAAPKEATTQVVTEANLAKDAPQLAPTSSRRPQSRPATPVEVAVDTAEADAKAAADVQAKADAADQADADAVAAALAEATATPEDTGGAQDVAEGPPMSQSEIEGLHVAINKCWNTGTMSTDALNTTIQIRVEMGEDGKPDYKSIKMTGFSGGSEAAAQIAFQVARKAVVLCGQKGYDLDPAKYGQWNVLNMTFDPNGMRLR